MSRPGSAPARERIGRVSLYQHHGRWWTYHREGGKPIRRNVGSFARAACEASLLNAQLIAAEAGLSFDKLLAARFGGSDATDGGRAAVPAAPIPAATAPPLSFAELRSRFLSHHEHVLHSAVRTLSRYAAATLYLENFAREQGLADAGVVSAAPFVAYLRSIEVSPNGHPNTARRKLADQGVRYIVETCRSAYHFGTNFGVLPAGTPNPFARRTGVHIRVRDAKSIFVFDVERESAFLTAAKPWAFAVHVTLAKTGLRPGELVHLLVEDVDLAAGWLFVHGKPELGWTTKTGTERRVPLLPEVAALLRQRIGGRPAGVLFLREGLLKACSQPPSLAGTRAELAGHARRRLAEARERIARPLTRREEARVYQQVWTDAGAIRLDRVRTSFIRTAQAAGIANATCPKSWRHTFATLLQQANVDVLVRQETLGHRPTTAYSSALGMTGVYTHTTPEFQRQEVERALRLRPAALRLASTWATRSIG